MSLLSSIVNSAIGMNTRRFRMIPWENGNVSAVEEEPVSEAPNYENYQTVAWYAAKREEFIVRKFSRRECVADDFRVRKITL